jgi:hypothetical protein
VILGVVYTPFVRIALAARAALDSHRDFTRDDVSAALSDPVFLVALRWYCCDSERSDPSTFDPFTPFDYKVGVPTDRRVAMSMGGLRLTDPLWVSRDLSLLSTFGGRPPYQDVVLIAAYPMGALSSSRDFAIFRESSSDGLQRRIDIRAGRITDAEFAQWR